MKGGVSLVMSIARLSWDSLSLGYAWVSTASLGWCICGTEARVASETAFTLGARFRPMMKMSAHTLWTAWDHQTLLALGLVVCKGVWVTLPAHAALVVALVWENSLAVSAAYFVLAPSSRAQSSQVSKLQPQIAAEVLAQPLQSTPTIRKHLTGRHRLALERVSVYVLAQDLWMLALHLEQVHHGLPCQACMRQDQRLRLHPACNQG